MNLLLAERLVLLARDQQSGRIVANPSNALKLAINAALVTELLDRGSAQLQGTRVVPGGPTGDPTLDWMLDLMHRMGRLRDIRYWVRWSGDLRRPMQERLVQQEVMTREERRVLGIFPVTSYRLESEAARDENANQVREALTGDGDIAPPAASLAALSTLCGLLAWIIGPGQRRAARQRGQEIAGADPGAEAVSRILWRRRVRHRQGATSAANTQPPVVPPPSV